MLEPIEKKLDVLAKDLVETNKQFKALAEEFKRTQTKLIGLSYVSKCNFNMLEAITKDRAEKHKQHFAYMTVSLKVLEKIAKKLGLEAQA